MTRAITLAFKGLFAPALSSSMVELIAVVNSDVFSSFSSRIVLPFSLPFSHSVLRLRRVSPRG